MEIIQIAYELIRDPKYKSDPFLVGPLGQIIYHAHSVVSELTSVPAEGEK